MSTMPRFAARGLCALLALAVAACDSTSPPVAAAIVVIDAGTSGVVGKELNPSPTIEIRDADGKRMSGVAFTVAVVAGGGSVTQTPQTTIGTGPTSIGLWRLGTTAGTNTVRISTEGVTPITVSAAGTPDSPAATSSGGGPLTANGLVGAVSVIQPSILVRDAHGNAVAGVRISVTVSAGGAVQNASPTTDANGVASAGLWTLGTVAGEQTARLSAGVSAPVVTFRVQADPGPATSAIATVNQAVSVTVGQVVPLTPTIRVVDQFGNGIAGLNVTSVASAGAIITNPTSVTNNNGEANAGVWTVGQAEGQYTVTMTAPGFAPVVFTADATMPRFNLDIRYIGGPPSAAIQAAFTAAKNKIEQIITADIPSLPVVNLNYAQFCQAPEVPVVVNEVIDDLLIFVVVGPIDGAGNGQTNILGQAGPCVLRGSSGLPAIGDMILDVFDLNQMVASGTIGDVVLHEMLHVVGVGSLWGPPPFGVFSLVTGFGGADPRYVGPNGRAAYTAAGGPAGNPTVPVHNQGGAGTRDSHWRESNFGRELMTPTISAPGTSNPLSVITVGALADMGYTTNPGAADPYVVLPGPEPNRAGVTEATGVLAIDVVRYPMFAADVLGRLTRIRDSRVPR